MSCSKIKIANYFFSIGLCLLVWALPGRADAASLSEGLATVTTGIYAKAACKTAIDALIKTVNGLDSLQFDNPSSDDNSLSGVLSLPATGSWDLSFFSSDCSKDVYAFLKPSQDLKILDMIESVSGMAAIDTLGLTSQAFILSNTESSLNPDKAPSVVAKALKDAGATDEIDVKPGLTVLGFMDLSALTLTSNALQSLGLKNSVSKIAIAGLLAEDTMMNLVAGKKGSADFTLVGTLPSVVVALLGEYKLPKSVLTFTTYVTDDGKQFKNDKQFKMDVAFEENWTSALGISGLTLSKVAVNVKIKSNGGTPYWLSAETKLGSQTLDVGWDKKSGDTKFEIKLSAPDDKTFKIGTLAGLSNVPGLDQLGFKELDITPTGFGGKLMWGGKELDVVVAFMGKSKQALVMFETETFSLKDIDKAVGSTPLGDISFPSMIMTLSEKDTGNVSYGELPTVAQTILNNLATKTGTKNLFSDGKDRTKFNIHKGVGMFSILDASKLGDAGKALGASGELIFGGTLGGIFGGDPEIDLYAAMPTFSSKKMPAFLTPVEDVTPKLTLKFKKTSNGIEADIGVDLTTDLKVGKQSLELDTAITSVISTSGVGINISASLGLWEDAFTLKNFDINAVAISVEVDADSSVSAAFRGSVLLKDGKTEFAIQALMSPDLAAVGLPKEVVFDLKANHISLEGFMDLADVFIGSTGNSNIAKAARGKGLYKKLQLNKLPKIDIVQYKDPKTNELADVHIYMATPGASDPTLNIDGMGMGFDGRLQVNGKDIAQVKADLNDKGFSFDGEVLIHKLGPLKIKNAKLDVAATTSDLPHFHLNADAVLLGVESAVMVEFDDKIMGFEITDKFGQVFTSHILAEATIKDPTNPDFDVNLSFQGDLLDYVLDGVEKELKKAIDVYTKDVKKAEAKLDSAKKKVDDEEKKVDAAFKTAEKDLDKAAAGIEKAIKKVNSLQKTINSRKGTINSDKNKLHDLDFWRVDKAIELGLEIAGLEVELGALYAGKATAVAAMEVAKSSVKLAPVLFQPVVLATNATFEAAKGAITVADLTVQASEYVLKGIEDAVEEYRKNFSFEKAEFDGSLQALLGNKAITMDAAFKAFGEPVNFDLSFKPTKPDEIGKAIDDVIKKLADQAIKDIKCSFFGGSSCGNSGSKNSATASSSNNKPVNPPGWSNDGPSDASIPLKGAKYKNVADNKCLLFDKKELKLGSCSGVKDDQLFRFSPKGDLVAIGSGTKSPYCLTAAGPGTGASVSVGLCNKAPLQKWHFLDGQLSIASGACAAVVKNAVVLADCDGSEKSQSWGTEPIADLAKLSETPQTHIYSVSLRTPKGSTCVDVADGMALEYACDDSDYQVLNLNSAGQLRVLNECIQAQSSKSGSAIHLGKCSKTKQKWQWIGEKMQLAGTQQCMIRSKAKIFGLTPVTLGECSSESSKWELEPSNVDPKGRILPAYAMIQNDDKCIEVRTKLQIDGLTAPASVLWSCNGDFNQGFSFRWNGEIRSLGKCLNATKNKAGSQVLVDDCYERPSALTPNFFKTAGQNRDNMNNQRWRLKKDGTIKKIGTQLCLSADPTGHRQFQFDPNAWKSGKPPITKGKVGGMGSLLTIEKCSSNKLQRWAVSNKLPDGKTVQGYKQLTHTIAGKQRCLETSGDSKFRKVIARTCKSNNNYQSYALTPNGEIRQMGRCLATDSGSESYGDGHPLVLAECGNTSEQKWTEADNGWIYQHVVPNSARITSGAFSMLSANKQFASAVKKKKAVADPSASASTPMCITEGQVFNPADSMPFLTSAQKSAMHSVASFALIGVESCTVAMKNSQTKTCMQVRSNGVLGLAKCNGSDANQNFGISGGKLVQRTYADKEFHVRKVWIDTAVDETMPSVNVTPDLKAAGNSPSKAIQNLMKTYQKSGFALDGKKHVLQYNKDAHKCIAVPAGKKLSSSKKKKLQSDLAKIPPQIIQATLMRKTSKIAHLQKQQKNINARLEADKKLDFLTVTKCSTAGQEKWTPVPVPATIWKVK